VVETRDIDLTPKERTLTPQPERATPQPPQRDDSVLLKDFDRRI